jgi:hypothetical protein
MWGTSLCWWANIKYPENIKEQLIELLFGESGLQLDIVRYNLGGGSNPDESVKQNFRLGGNMPCIKDNNGGFCLENDKLQLSILDAAIKKGVNNVELFCNSPPWWMTKSGVTNGSKTIFDCNLKKEYVDDYVNFLSDSYNLLKKIYPVKSIDPFNEPSNPFWTPAINQEGCYFDYITRWDVIKGLKNLNKDIFISGVDEFSIGFALFWYIFSPRWLIDRINIHGYRLTYKDFTFYFDDFNIWKRLLRWLTNKPIWISEYGYGYSDTVPESLPLARKIFNDLKLLKPEAWVYWQAIENINGSKWGLIQLDFKNPSTIKIQKQYYIFKHFTRNIKSGDEYEFINTNVIKIKGDKIRYIILNDTQFDITYNVKETIIEYTISNNKYNYKTYKKNDIYTNLYLSDINDSIIIKSDSIMSIVCKNYENTLVL